MFKHTLTLAVTSHTDLDRDVDMGSAIRSSASGQLQDYCYCNLLSLRRDLISSKTSLARTRSTILNASVISWQRRECCLYTDACDNPTCSVQLK